MRGQTVTWFVTAGNEIFEVPGEWSPQQSRERWAQIMATGARPEVTKRFQPDLPTVLRGLEPLPGFSPALKGASAADRRSRARRGRR